MLSHQSPLHSQPWRDAAYPSPGTFSQQGGLLQIVDKDKTYLGAVHLRREKMGTLSSQFPFPLVKIYSMRAGFSTLLNSVIWPFDSCPGRLVLFLRVWHFIWVQSWRSYSVWIHLEGSGLLVTPPHAWGAWQGCYMKGYLQYSPGGSRQLWKEGYQKKGHMVYIYLLHFSLHSLRIPLCNLKIKDIEYD